MKNLRQCIVVALSCEARPFIEGLALKKNSASHPFPVFENDTTRLIVSGIGKVRSAAAVSYLISGELPGMIVNIGVGGSADKQKPLGKLFAIHKITDHAASRDFYPESLTSHDLDESSVITFDRPVTNSDEAGTGLVDMEASGYFQTAAMFLPTQNIHCLKIVSDHLDISNLNAKVIGDFVNQNVSAIRLWMDRSEALKSPHSIWSEHDEKLTIGLSERLRLTETQSHQLKHWCKTYRIRRNQSLEPLFAKFRDIIQTKAESKNVLERLRQVLLA